MTLRLFAPFLNISCMSHIEQQRPYGDNDDDDVGHCGCLSCVRHIAPRDSTSFSASSVTLTPLNRTLILHTHTTCSYHMSSSLSSERTRLYSNQRRAQHLADTNHPMDNTLKGKYSKVLSNCFVSNNPKLLLRRDLIYLRNIFEIFRFLKTSMILRRFLVSKMIKFNFA